MNNAYELGLRSLHLEHFHQYLRIFQAINQGACSRWMLCCHSHIELEEIDLQKVFISVVPIAS